MVDVKNAEIALLSLLSDYDNVAVIDLYSACVIGNDKQNIFSKYVSGDFSDNDYMSHLKAFSEQLVYDSDRSKVINAMGRDMLVCKVRGTTPYYVNYRVRINNEILYYQTKFIKDVTGTRGNAVIMATHDVSEEIKDYVSKLSASKAKADAMNAARNEFLLNFSHDIRTPINGVVGMLELAKRNISDVEKVSKYLEDMTDESNYLQSLLSDVLDISSIEDNHVTIMSRPMNINMLANDCISIATKRIGSKGIILTPELDEFKHPYLLGDEQHLKKVIVNILNNAVKFTRDGDCIYFRVREENDNASRVMVRFEIEDTGIGMRPEFVERIFDPFAQEYKGVGDSSSTGSGLGLTIVKKLLDLMGGTIKVESAPGIGSKFTISIALDIDIETEESLMGKKVNKRNCIEGSTVLVVEDNSINLTIASSILEEWGVNVITATDGYEAISAFEHSEISSIDIILMDVMMPNMNGLKAAKSIRMLERPDAKDVPIIAMTANVFEEDIQKSREAGMNDHLSKPVKPSVLKEAILKYI